MENKENRIAIEPKSEDFDFKNHFATAGLGALYYLFVYIPVILPFKIWGQAASRISLLWRDKSVLYSEGDKSYPLFTFYYNYLINFVFDALIFLAWPIGFVFSTYTFIDSFSSSMFVSLFIGYLISLASNYLSVLLIRLGKETLFFALNNLLTWIIDVVKNIGKLIKNMWLLNFVIKKKHDNSKINIEDL